MQWKDDHSVSPLSSPVVFFLLTAMLLPALCTGLVPFYMFLTGIPSLVCICVQTMPLFLHSCIVLSGPFCWLYMFSANCVAMLLSSIRICFCIWHKYVIWHVTLSLISFIWDFDLLLTAILEEVKNGTILHVLMKRYLTISLCACICELSNFGVCVCVSVCD